MSILLPVLLGDVNAKFVIDTGACVSIISSGLYYRIPPDSRPELRPVDGSFRLEVADDNLLPVEGLATVEFKVNKDLFTWEVCVAPIREDGLIGLDFLQTHEYMLGAKAGLRLDNRKYDTIIEKVPLRAVRVICREDVIVPANSEFILEGEGNSMSLCSDYGLISPCGDIDIDGLIVGNSLVKSSENGLNLPVRVANVSCENLEVKRGTTLGFMHSVDDCEIMSSGDVSDHPKVCPVSECKEVDVSSWALPLQELFHRSCENLDEDQADRLKALLDRYQNVFSRTPMDLGRTDVMEHTIPTGDARPIKLAPRRTPRAFVEEEEKIIKEQLDAGLIRPSTSPWSAALVFVRKKDGTVRPCVDYRRLNEVTAKDAYPLPQIQDCLDSLEGAKFFCVADLTAGFFQISLKESDIEKTAFSTSKGGLYEYVVMPMGLSGSPNSFQRCMELVFRGLQWRTLLIYLDDIICFGRTFEETLARLEEVLRRLLNANLKLKPQKTDLFKLEVSFLGFKVTSAGVMPQTSKVQYIQAIPVPKNLTELRHFLGYLGYYRRFIRGFSMRAAPLNRLMEAGQSFIWTEECQAAFLDLKSALFGNEVMAFPRFDDKGGVFIVDCDASNYAIGGCLSQMQWSEETNSEVERPIMFASKTLDKTQRRYCTTRKELLSVITFVQQFKIHLLGRKFIIRSDNSSLRWLMRFKNPTDQLARWLEVLAQYDFTLIHRKGRNHRNADFWSRIDCDPYTCDCYERDTILKELPCGGCELCTKKQREWTILDDFDDVVPLFARNVSCGKPEQKGTQQGFCIRVALAIYTLFCVVFGAVPQLAWKALARFKQDTCFSLMSIWPGSINRLRPRRNKKDLVEQSVFRLDDESDQFREKGSLNSDRSPLDDDSLRNDGLLKELKRSSLASYQPEQIRVMQRDDPEIGKVVGWKLHSDTRPSRDIVAGESPFVRNLWLLWDQLCFKDGVLFKRWIAHKGAQSYLQLILPSILRKQVLESAHSAISSGHLGVNKTASKIQRMFYWHMWKDSVVNFIRSCVKCGSRKRPGKTPKSPMKEYTVSFPMDRIVTDLLGPLPQTKRGSKYILCVQDSFTKFVEIYPLPDQKSSTVAQKLVHEFYSRYGCSLDIHSDKGSTYTSELFTEVCRLLEIKKTSTSGFRPQANGQIEKFNSVLLNMISTYIDKTQTNWDLNLSLLTMGYNSTVNPSTGFTPCKLFFGREFILPVQLQIGCLPYNSEYKTKNEFVQNLETDLQDCFQIAREHLRRNVSRMKRNYDTRISQRSYEKGDLVYLKDLTRKIGHCKKLDPNIWVGPYSIIRKYSDLLFEIQGKPGTRPKLVHHDRIKPFLSDEIPNWLYQRTDSPFSREKAIVKPRRRQTKVFPKQVFRETGFESKVEAPKVETGGQLRRGARKRKQTQFL